MASRVPKKADIEDYYAIKVSAIWSSLKQESAAFWLLCVYIFFEYVRPQTIYPAIDILPWAQIVLLLAALTAYFDKSIKFVSNIENRLLIIFFLIILLSSLFAFLPATSFSNLNVAVNWIILYFLIISIVNTEKRFLIFILLFLLVSFKMSQHGFRTFATRGFSFASWGVSGAPGWFNNSGEFGIQMTIFVPLAVTFIMALKGYWGRFKRWFFYLMPITGLIAIVATSSRGAQLAIIVVGLWFVLRTGKGIKTAFGVLLVGSILYMVMPQEQKTRFDTMGEDQTSVERLEHWRFGVDTTIHNPILGIGYSNWLKYCWYKDPFKDIPAVTCHLAHNMYVECMSELGIPGLIVFMLMLYQMFKQNSRTRIYARKVDNKFLLFASHGLDGGLIGLMVSGFFISVLFYPFVWVQLAMTVALNEVSRNQAKEI